MPGQAILRLPASVHVYRRFDYDGSASSLYFEGGSSRIRIIKGVDFQAEQALFSRFTFVEGNAVERSKNASILLSEPVARKLGVHIGDNVTIFMRTSGDCSIRPGRYSICFL
jgi:ABC-type lipoprotein release transport system permease subunit